MLHIKYIIIASAFWTCTLFCFCFIPLYWIFVSDGPQVWALAIIVWMSWSAYLIASRARAMRLCRALSTSMPALLTNREKQMENHSTTSQPWTVTRSTNVSMNTAKTLECGSWNIRVNTSVTRFNSIELNTRRRPRAHCSASVLFQYHTRRMAIANGTCVSFCNQPKAKFGYLTSHAGMSLPSPVLRVEAKESLRHILAFPGYATRTIAVNVHGWKEDTTLVKCLAA